MKKNKAIFFDRDGVINRPIIKNKKPFSPRNTSEFIIYKDFKKFNNIKDDFIFIIITNQPDLRNKKIKKKQINIFHNKINKVVKMKDIFICKHIDRDKCDCRKPKNGGILKMQSKHNIDLKKSYFIGDRWKDMVAGSRSKCINIFIDRKYHETKGKKFKCKFRCKNIGEAFKFITG
jgi:D-glycero-D-manno-heptose 1,7-bisphosphate phosphatase